MEQPLSEPLRQILERHRDRLNAHFHEVQRYQPTLRPEDWFLYLRNLLNPTVEAILQTSPTQAEHVFEALYTLLLELMSKELLGKHSRYPLIYSGLQTLLPCIPHLLTTTPRIGAGQLANALYNLAALPEEKAQQWIQRMQAVAIHRPERETFFKAGQIAAWQCGLAHYRIGALQHSHQLPENILCALLAMPNSHPVPIAEMLEQMQNDPWFRPEHFIGSLKIPYLVATVGGFRGLGGPFMTPPQVLWSGEHFVVSERHKQWILHADHFGATLSRCYDRQPYTPSAQDFSISEDGIVSYKGQSFPFPELSQPTSIATNGEGLKPSTTLVITLKFSHQVYILGAVATEPMPME